MHPIVKWLEIMYKNREYLVVVDSRYPEVYGPLNEQASLKVYNRQKDLRPKVKIYHCEVKRSNTNERP